MRYVLLDRITELVPEATARGLKCVSLAEDVFEHHFPGHPILPGALITESLAQLGGCLLESTLRARGHDHLHALLVGIERARFRRQVRPGDRLELMTRVISASVDGGQVAAEARLDGALAAEAELRFAFTLADHPRLIERRRAVLNLWLHGSSEPLVAESSQDRGRSG